MDVRTNIIRIIKYVIGILIVIVLFVVLFIVYVTITDYKPDNKIIIEKNNSSVIKKDTLSFLIWNIGYAGLGADMDFFYDGGTKIRTTKTNTEKNIRAISNFIKNSTNVDFFLLQEVDKSSKRTYYINEKSIIEKATTNINWIFCPNYKVSYVPIPLRSPLGNINSGLLIGSKKKSSLSVRYKFYSSYKWPKSLFMLDRCFLVNYFPLTNNDSLVVINTHNTAYDNGDIRNKQVMQLKEWLISNYSSNKYFIIGGDWNQTPPNFNLNHFCKVKKSKYFIIHRLSSKFLLPNWKCSYDISTPSNRGLDTVLWKNSQKTIIDFFVTSPNIEVLSVKTFNLGFKNSDHNPVRLTIRLKH